MERKWSWLKVNGPWAERIQSFAKNIRPTKVYSPEYDCMILYESSSGPYTLLLLYLWIIYYDSAWRPFSATSITNLLWFSLRAVKFPHLRSCDSCLHLTSNDSVYFRRPYTSPYPLSANFRGMSQSVSWKTHPNFYFFNFVTSRWTVIDRGHVRSIAYGVVHPNLIWRHTCCGTR